jgi:penicillin amidase
MQRIRKLFFYTLLILLGLSALAASAGLLFLRWSLPPQDGEFLVRGLSASVEVKSDPHGIPVIEADNRADALRALGYVTARDRLFQMDLMRRKTAGRLAELFGQVAANSDIRARTYGFSRVAKAVVAKLPQAHRRYLEAYAEGINSYIDNAQALPFEFTALAYRPERWKPEDSLLVALGMFDTLTAKAEREERMLTVMEKSLPADVVSFLTPDTDRFTDSLYGSAEPYRPSRPIPVASLETALARRAPDAQKLTEAVQLNDLAAGSNAWAVSGARTHDGRAILANDMHLGISVPNIWYRAEMDYGTGRMAGVTLPGIPVFIAGSNGRLAWGGTNLTGDFLDLVTLEINPEKPDQYRAGNQWQSFERRHEIIRVKGGEPVQITVRRSIWGPVAQEPLLGKPVAVHWSALDDSIVNLALLDLDQAETLEQAMAVVNHAGGPQLNFLLADNQGHIGWTVMGQIPKRVGFDGSVSRSWADGTVGWDGYVDAHLLPREIDPASGMLVSANDRRLGREYPYVIGRQFASGYRAYRITQRLKEMPVIDEWAMFGLQLDTENEFHGFYRRLALDVLSPRNIERQPELQELRDALLAWNGRADTDSLGFALLVRFRQQLATSVFSPFLEASRNIDKNFNYAWTYIDTPLQAMLTEKVPQLLPDPVNYRSWDEFILGQLKRSARQLKADYPDTALAELAWGQVNKAHIGHPFSKALPLLGLVLDMPADALAGCANCVRALGPEFGASERLVVSPAHLDEGIMHMPGGQSGHPLSPHYRDQHRYWVKGLPLALLAGKPEHKLTLKPDPD